MNVASKSLSPRWLYFVVFISGMCSLAVEMASSRLLGNVFGSSNLVWACIIGLILIYLTVGYFVGGRWADKKPDPAIFCSILLWAGLSIVLIPVIAKPILRFAADAFDKLQIGVLAGSFVSVLILLAIPMILLGTASPYAIRLSISDTDKSGQVSGRIYAISTIGSFVGTFIPTLFSIPLIGTYRTFISFGLVLIVVAWLALYKTSGFKRSAPYLAFILVSVVLLVLGVNGTIKKTTGQVFESESQYNYIQVLKSDGVSMLRLNEGQGVHSIYSPDVQNFYGPWEQFLVGPFFNQAPFTTSNVKSIAIVGLAAGTTARAATTAFGSIPIDGWEIDGKIVDAGRKYFNMNETNLNVYVQDGRWGLTQSTKKYSLIAIDAYRPPYIPVHLTSKEFFQVVYDHLDEDGAAVINVGRSPSDRRLINDLATTLRSVFPSVYVMDIPNTFNSMIYATRQPTEARNLLNNLIQLTEDKSTPPLLLETIQIALANLKDTPPTTQVYTDDRSPIEWVTNTMVLQYLVTDDLSILEK
jgi:predicted membrane-bound spermidine synthase